jgi:DNA polymerase III alpha subunit (gram-positive type)
MLVQSDGVKVTDEITEITGINQQMVDKFGLEPETAFDEARYFLELPEVEAVVAFNGRRFDIPMMKQWAKRIGKTWPEKFVIDPYEDLPTRPQELITMCAKNGIYYDAHAASADVEAMLRLMSKFPFETVLERAKSPVVIIQSQQHRSENEKVKKHRFRWNAELKIWYKPVKQIDLEALAKAVNNEFPMRERPDLNLEGLESA